MRCKHKNDEGDNLLSHHHGARVRNNKSSYDLGSMTIGSSIHTNGASNRTYLQKVILLMKVKMEYKKTKK